MKEKIPKSFLEDLVKVWTINGVVPDLDIEDHDESKISRLSLGSEFEKGSFLHASFYAVVDSSGLSYERYRFSLNRVNFPFTGASSGRMHFRSGASEIVFGRPFDNRGRSPEYMDAPASAFEEFNSTYGSTFSRNLYLCGFYRPDSSHEIAICASYFDVLGLKFFCAEWEDGT